MMTGSSGFVICTQLRKLGTVPIIMLTARDSDLDYATGLSLGSDDYFTKPFSAMSLVMMVKAIFRRIEYENRNTSPQGEEQVLAFANVIIDIKGKTVTVDDKEISLTPNEYDVLKYLMEHKDEAVSRDELLEKVWGYASEVETRATDYTIRRLRKKLEESSIIHRLSLQTHLQSRWRNAPHGLVPVIPLCW